MTSTSHPEFNEKTESLEVAEKFSAQISGRTILVTGVNREGVGFATAKAFVRDQTEPKIVLCWLTIYTRLLKPPLISL